MRARDAMVGLALAAQAGCWLDFDQFQPRRDAAAEADIADVTAPDLAPPEDASVDAFDAPEEPAPDVAPPVDRGPDVPFGCQPGRATVTQVRVAHMAPEVGAIDICMQKRGRTPTTTMARFQSTLWPAEGLEYGQVSRSVPLNTVVTASNEAWDIAVVERGTPCDRVPADLTPLATRSIQLDPGTLRLIVITAEPALDGHLVPFVNLVADENCTDCNPGTVDVRAVHAALGASSQRLTFSLLPQAPWSVPSSILAMRTFATGVSYGGDQGYACNQIWGSAFNVESRINPPAQLEVTTAAGRLVARSATIALKRAPLASTRTVTVFFEGAFSETGAGQQAPGFIVCYDGSYTGLLSNCERVAAATPAADAGSDAWSDAAADVPPADVVDDLVASVDPPDASVP
ncbi:MAG: hypothetical protein U0324_02220 [Polyangiales bacterium]